MAVSPTVQAIADAMSEAFGGRSMTERPHTELRAMTAAMVQPSAVPVGATLETAVRSGARDVPVRVYRTGRTAERGVVLWLHGGGFVLDGLELGDDLSRRLCDALGLAVVNVDYAVAPEAPFPAAVDDVLAVYEWLLSGPAELAGCATARVAVAGDSAGGNLATVLCLRARDEGLPQPACQVSVYGTAECVISNPELGDLVFLTNDDVEWFWSAYTDDRAHPYVSPLRADSLAGLAPLLVVTAEHDPTRDASERYAQALQRAGGVAIAKRYPGVHHGFFGLVDVLAEARAAFDDVVAFVDRHLEERA